MRMSNKFAAVAVASLVLAPVAAAANPAAGLSLAPVAKSVAASAGKGKKTKLSQGGTVLVVLAAAGGVGIAAGILATRNATSASR